MKKGCGYVFLILLGIYGVFSLLQDSHFLIIAAIVFVAAVLIVALVALVGSKKNVNHAYTASSASPFILEQFPFPPAEHRGVATFDGGGEWTANRVIYTYDNEAFSKYKDEERFFLDVLPMDVIWKGKSGILVDTRHLDDDSPNEYLVLGIDGKPVGSLIYNRGLKEAVKNGFQVRLRCVRLPENERIDKRDIGIRTIIPSEFTIAKWWHYQKQEQKQISTKWNAIEQRKHVRGSTLYKEGLWYKPKKAKNKP